MDELAILGIIFVCSIVLGWVFAWIVWSIYILTKEHKNGRTGGKRSFF